MKERSIAVGGVIIALLLLLVFNGCNLLGVSKEQRISLFLDDLNQNPRPNSIRFHFSSSCSDYDIIDGGYFSGVSDFPENSIPYAFTISSYDPDIVTGTASGTAGSFGGPWPIEFTMVRERFDWYILKLVLDGSVIVQ